MNIIIISFSILAFFGIYLYYTYRKIKNMPVTEDSKNLKILTDQNFQNQIKTGVTLVDFWASWCMPCKMMAPILNQVAEELNGKTSVTIGKINIEEFQSTPSKYGVRSIPTLILFKNGKEIQRYVGIKNKEFLVNQINQNSN